MRLLVLTFFLIGCCFPVLGWGQVGMLSKGNWVKIAVPNEGVYQLTGAQFKAMGFASKPNANQVQLYGMDLAKLIEKVPNALPDSLTEMAIEMQDVKKSPAMILCIFFYVLEQMEKELTV